MSGPIVRKYGFPNFDKIFGERDLAHGVEDAAKAETESETPAEEAPEAEAAEKPKKKGSSKKKKS